jgi:NADH-quinone oxidoreductase subunit L
MPGVLHKDVKPVVAMLNAKYGFDAFNERVIVPFTRSLGNYFWRIGDMLCIDGFMVNGTAHTIGRVATMLKSAQTGYLYHYVFVIIAGLLGLLIWTVYL